MTRRRRVARPRRGVALFAALSLLVVLGLLVSAGVASTFIAGRSSRFAELDVSLGAAVDYAVSSVLAAPDSFGLASLPYGVPRTFDIPISDGPPRRATVTATRIAGNLVWLVGEAASTASDRGRRRASVLARFRSIGALPSAPVVARRPVTLGDDVRIDVDSTGDPDCAVAALPSATAVASDSAAFFLTSTQLARLDSAANTLHVRHDTTLGPGSFAGVMVIDGTLTVVGPMAITGLVVARGPIRAPSGLSLSGAMMSFDATDAPITLDHAIVRYSVCDVARQLRRASAPQRVRVRGWAELI